MSSRPNVELAWRGASPPTARELKALQNAARALAPGRYTVSPARARQPNPASARSAYRAFHWGEPANSVRTARIPNFGELFELGKLRRVDYETNKGGERAVWFHHFSRPYPTLTATPHGKLGPIVGGHAHVTADGIEG